MAEGLKQNQPNQGQAQLARKPVLPLLLQYAVPGIISMLVTSLYNIVDQVFIGRGEGYLGNGATTLAFPVITVGLAFALLIGNGAAALVNIQMGAGKKEDAQKALGHSLTLCLGSSILLMLVGLVVIEPLFRLMHASEEVMPYALTYTGIILLGFPLNGIGVCLSNLIRADGSPRYSMLSVLAGALLNVVLDPIFIFQFGMGVAGAAIATVISQGVSMLVVLYYFWRRGQTLRFRETRYKPERRYTLRILALGSSSFITQAAIALVNAVMSFSLSFYGEGSIYGSDIPLSAMGIVMKISAIVISVVLGFVVGAQPILGFNYGAGNYARVRRTYLTTISFTFTFTALSCLFFVIFPEVAVSIFNDPDPHFNEFAARSMRIFLCCMFTAGIQIPSANYFQAVGKPLKAMTLSMTRQILLLVPALLILPIFFGLDGILYAGPMSDLGSMCVTVCFIVWEMRKLGKLSGGPDPRAVPDG